MAFAVAFLAVALARPDDDKYTTKYDDFDVDEVLANKRLLQNYVSCVLDKGACTKEGNVLKGKYILL